MSNKPLSLSKDYKRYLMTIGIAATISWIAWAMVIYKLDPYESTGTALSLFFISLFFSMIGSFTILGFILRQWLSQEEIEQQHMAISLRQGLLLSMTTLFCTGLLLAGVLTWWNGLFVIALAVLVEMLFTARD